MGRATVSARLANMVYKASASVKPASAVLASSSQRDERLLKLSSSQEKVEAQLSKPLLCLRLGEES